jgi:hypothetical protein
MIDSRPRLKGLDEMPRRWRTPRQWYFFVRARILGSKNFRWIWPLSKLALVALVLLLVAHLCGFPIERTFRHIIKHYG